MTSQVVKRKVLTVSDFRFTGRQLGKGNFARVEEAIHSILNVKVAVKIIDIGEIKEKYVVKNLHREARIMSTLNHPCIVALFQTMQLADNVYYLVTELVSGGDLCSFIIGQRYGKLEERQARIYARQFVSALSHMHSFGIVHRDLKMENVMLNATQTQIKIVDFGLSNVWTSESPLRTHCGSPEYAAPELFVAGKEYGPEVDLWSLGIIFYGMVVGQLPFVSGRKNQLSSQERRKKLVAQINKGLGTTQRQAISALSLEFRAMMNKLLMADPAKRITVRELIVHPWVTERGRKIVQTHPIKKLDSHWQTKLTKQIGDFFQMDQKSTVGEIFKNPYGRLGGIYNIMHYKSVVESFNPEEITQNLIMKTEVIKHNEIASPPKVSKPRSAPPKSNKTLYNQCVVLLNKISKQQTDESSRSKSATAATRIMTRNATKIARAKVAEQTPEVMSKAKSSVVKPHSAAITRKMSESRAENLAATAATAPVKKLATRMTTGHLNKNCSSACSGKTRRPSASTTTTNTRPNTSGNKPLKRTSVSATAPSGSKSNPAAARRQVCPNPAEMGDGSIPLKKRDSSYVVLQTQRSGRPLCKDPIAKSIAGYLVKNVSDKMLSLQMMRK